MAQNFPNSRRHPRHTVQLSVVCGSSQSRLADRVVNVSNGGARIQTPEPLPPGTVHPFVFTMPDAKFHDAPVAVTAKVTWVAEHEMGIRFEYPCGGIDDYVKRLERSLQSF